MIAVVASRLDPGARRLVEAWAPYDARLLSAEDLCHPGWTFRLRSPEDGKAVIDEEIVPVSRLRAVITRRPAIVPEELSRVAVSDRGYVAAEANAFLLGWLATLPCPVFNEPTATSLCGPSYTPLHWSMLAARLGMPWGFLDPSFDPAAIEHVIVCGDSAFGASDQVTARNAVLLAHAAHLKLLQVDLANNVAFSASVLPPLDDGAVRDALLQLIEAGC